MQETYSITRIFYSLKNRKSYRQPCRPLNWGRPLLARSRVQLHSLRVTFCVLTMWGGYVSKLPRLLKINCWQSCHGHYWNTAVVIVFIFSHLTPIFYKSIVYSKVHICRTTSRISSKEKSCDIVLSRRTYIFMVGRMLYNGNPWRYMACD